MDGTEFFFLSFFKAWSIWTDIGSCRLKNEREKQTGTNRGDFSSSERIYHENVTKFQLLPTSLFCEGRKDDLLHNMVIDNRWKEVSIKIIQILGASGC